MWPAVQLPWLAAPHGETSENLLLLFTVLGLAALAAAVAVILVRRSH